MYRVTMKVLVDSVDALTPMMLSNAVVDGLSKDFTTVSVAECRVEETSFMPPALREGLIAALIPLVPASERDLVKAMSDAVLQGVARKKGILL